MKKEIVKFFILFSMIFCFALITNKSFSVPVSENKTEIIGIVKGYSIISSGLINVEPEQKIYKLTVKITETKNLNNSNNYLSRFDNDVVELYSKNRLSSELYGTKIRILIKYSGDEKGGLFWIQKIYYLW